MAQAFLPPTNGLSIYTTNDPSNVISPMIVSPYSVLTVPAYWRAINFLTNNLGSFPRYVQGPDGGRVKHPLDTILRIKPNNYQNCSMLYRTWFFHAAHHGRGYLKITRKGAINGLHNVNPYDCFPFRYQDDQGNIDQYYFIRSAKEIIHGSDMLVIHSLSYDGMQGIDPVELMAETFQRATTIDRWFTRYLQKGTNIRGAIEFPTGVQPEQVEEAIALVNKFFRGANGERDIIVLSDGAHLSNTTISPQESQIAEQGAYTTKQIAQLTGVSPEFLFEMSESKYNNVLEVQGSNVVRYTFRPFMEQTEDEWSLKMLSDSEQQQGFRIQMDASALTRGDTASLTATATLTVNAGIRTRNEGRAVLGLPPDPNPDSNKLITLGAVTPQLPKGPKQQEPPVDPDNSELPPESAKPKGMAFTTMRGVIESITHMIETKTENAFSSKNAAKPAAEKTIWANVFAEQQQKYTREALQPIAQALQQIDGTKMDVEAVAEQYATEIRRKAATGQSKTLIQIIEQMMGDQNGN